MEEEGGRVPKVGAEGVYVAGDPERGLGVALKVEDGAGRAAPPALMEVLDRAEVLSPEAKRALRDFAEPVIRNTLGDEVGPGRWRGSVVHRLVAVEWRRRAVRGGGFPSR